MTLQRRLCLVLIALSCATACANPEDITSDSSARRDARVSDAVTDRPGDGPQPFDVPTRSPLSDGQGPMDAAWMDATSGSDACANRADGAFCEGTTLRVCSTGRSTSMMSCSDGCLDRGNMSVCLSDAVDPCFNDPDGSYCGGSIGAVNRVNDVYVCRNRRTERIDACTMGCEGPMGMSRCVTVMMVDPCTRAVAGDGAYCGSSLMAGDANTLYQCQGRRTTNATPCPSGCVMRPPGQPDVCAPMAGAGYRLPFACATRVTVTQGNNSAVSHNGSQAWAYDFGVNRGTAVHAMEAGTVLRINSSVVAGGACWNGGGAECANTVNYVLLSHADGTNTLYLHLDAPEVAVGARVTRGQRIARSGNTGWSTGPHLHVQRQANCASWFCVSQSLTFADVGMPASNASVVSGNCP